VHQFFPPLYKDKHTNTTITWPVLRCLVTVYG